MHRSLVQALLTSALTLAFSVTAFAQTAVPDTISYQGRVTDASGNPVAPGTSTTRTAFFRIYDSSSGGTRVWSEQQTITVASGDFSVLLGTGTPIIGETNANALNAIFTSKDRYLGITIDDGVAPAETEITPRQQLVTTAFAFRAKVAEGVTAGAVTGAMIANNTITGTQIAPATIVASNISTGGVNSTNILDGAITAVDIADGSITPAKFAGTVGAWTGSGSDIYRSAGKVGIGTSAPASTLHLHQAAAVTGVFPSLQATDSTSGVTATDGFAVGLGAEAYAWLYEDRPFKFATNNTERLRITGAGNVGIGTASPGVKLDVNGAINVFDSGTKSRHAGIVSEANGTLVNFGINDNRFGGTQTNTDQGGLFRVDSRSGVNLFAFNARAANATAPTEIVSITSAGTVGIGTTTPAFPLSFPSTLGDKIAFWGQSGAHYGIGVQGALLQIHTDAWGGDIAFGYGSSASFSETMRIKGSGLVGIGTNAPSKGTLHIATWANNSNLPANTVYNRGSTSNQAANSVTSLSIYAEVDIGARQFLSFSDARIKRIEGRSDASRDLATLMGIEVTDYTHIDTVAKGAGKQKKVIAQQVETVYPQAVSRSTDEVPDIYQHASFKDGWISLATNLKQGERVRLNAGKKQEVVEVLEVAEGKFRTAFTTVGDEVFVYGREVKDFRTVDYDAIEMLNLSATQQIKREKDAEVKSLQEQNAALAARIAELEKHNAALAAQNSTAVSRLDALEKRFQAFARTAKVAGNE